MTKVNLHQLALDVQAGKLIDKNLQTVSFFGRIWVNIVFAVTFGKVDLTAKITDVACAVLDSGLLAQELSDARAIFVQLAERTTNPVVKEALEDDITRFDKILLKVDEASKFIKKMEKANSSKAIEQGFEKLEQFASNDSKLSGYIADLSGKAIERYESLQKMEAKGGKVDNKKGTQVVFKNDEEIKQFIKQKDEQMEKEKKEKEEAQKKFDNTYIGMGYNYFWGKKEQKTN